jgi:hypothetical protein
MWCSTCAGNQAHVQRTGAGWSGEDVILHELGRQRVHDVHVDGTHAGQICPEHLRMRQSRSDFANGVAAQVGLDHRYPTIQTSPPRDGKCDDCARVSGTQSLEHPWNPRPVPGARPVHEERQPTPHVDTDEAYQRGRWPYRPLPPNRTERHVPVDLGIQSLNHRVAVMLERGDPARLRTRATMRFQAHDSGDGETIFHCPFCGSGQVLARSDGTVECEFCSTAFTVQVQPQMPAFPQTIDGVPVDVPGMPAGGANANVPPGAAPGMDPAAGGPPGAEGEAPEEDAEAEGGDDKPAFLKGSLLLRTAAGAVLPEESYMRHLALAHARDRDAVLAQIRDENGAG